MMGSDQIELILLRSPDMPYMLTWSPPHQREVHDEFMALLNDPNDPAIGGDAAQLGLDLQRLALRTGSTPAGPRRVEVHVYPSGGLCAGFYTYALNDAPFIYVVGFCQSADMAQFFRTTAQPRLSAVP
jgi:hypothetical protein